MMQSTNTVRYHADVIVVGGGLAGLVATIELLTRGRKVLLLERDNQTNLGGMAKNSFGGIMLVGSKSQKRSGIKDSCELALADWLRYAEFSEEDTWPQRWAQYYVEHSIDIIYEWLKKRKIRFLPVVNWPERGMFVKGNSVPRWHIAWGTGFQIIKNTILALNEHINKKNLSVQFGHKVTNFILQNKKVIGCRGDYETSPTRSFEAYSDATVIACGGICGGDLSFLKKSWDEKKGAIPQVVLNGSHRYADGLLHDSAHSIGASLVNLDKHWHYAAGIHHPDKTPDVSGKGLSLVPPRSALWLNALGERIGPTPLVSYTDTSYLVDTILKQPGQYSWQVLNWNIAIRELAVSGCQYMTSFLKRNKLKLLRDVLFGNKSLVNRLIRESNDIVVANSLEELVKKMKGLTQGESLNVSKDAVLNSVRNYDSMLSGSSCSDFQFKKIMEFKKYKGDRIRIAKSQKIEDRKALPLIAIREFILSRKSLGGIETNLACQVLRHDDKSVIPGLYAIGEASGFGGGGIHGKRSLEGTFLGSCILTGYKLAQSL